MGVDSKRVTIVGAGPAGCAAGAALASRGYDVEIFDLRDDFRDESPDGTGRVGAQRSINLALSVRGLTTLDMLGCGDRARSLGVAMHGREVHRFDGSTEFQPYGQPGQYLLSVPRNGLSAIVLDAAEAAGCSVHFNHKCLDVFLEETRTKMQGPEGEGKLIEADLIIGADGAFSKVRAALMRQERFNYSQEYIHAAYKELSMPPELTQDMRREALHIWPRHNFMLIALPNLDGSFTCTLFHEHDALNKLTSEEDVMDLFLEFFVDATPRIPNLAQQFFENPTPGLVTIRSYPYHYKKSALLLGDAAHAIVPFYGQGCNLALEDVRIFTELLDNPSVEMEELLSTFTLLRKKNADTIAQLALDNYNEMASKTTSLLFRLKKRFGLFMNRIAPSTFMPLYTMVSFTNIPYSEAVERARISEQIVANVLSGALYSCGIGAIVALALLSGRKYSSLKTN